MPTEVDNRVVQMTFNNKSFEKGVEQTLSTLDKLKKALKFDNASKGFEEIQQAADGTDLTRITAAVDKLSDRFSGLGIIGMQVWSRIGNAAIDMVTGPFKKAEQMLSNTISSITNQIESGGWARALNIDKAKNMILNLGYAWDAVSKEEYALNRQGEEMANIYYSVNKAVDGTAYSLDEAAVASANFLAAGVDGGTELTDTLRAAMGVASTYSKDFNQVSNYFQKVATAGVVTQSVLSDMQMVGIESSSVLRDYLGLTQEELEEAIKDRLITFDQFRDAYLDKFGDSLDKANDTYEGALSNMKSAMSRIGAVIAQPLVDELIPAMNLARLAFNNVNKALQATLFSDVVDTIQNAGKALRDTFAVLDDEGRVVGLSEKALDILDEISIGISGIASLFKGMRTILAQFGKAFVEVFLKDGEKGKSFMQKFADAMEKFNDSVNNNKSKILSAFKGYLTILKTIFDVLKPLIAIALKALTVALKITSAVAILVGKLILVVKESKAFKLVANAIKTVLDGLRKIIDKVVDSILDFIIESNLLDKAIDVISKGFEYFGKILEFIWNVLKLLFADLIAEFKEFVETYDPINAVLTGLKQGFEFLKDAIQFVIDKIEEWLGIDIKFPSLDSIGDELESIKEKFEKVFSDPEQAAKDFYAALVELKDYLTDKAAKGFEAVGEKLTPIKDYFVNIGNAATGAKKKVGEFASDDTSFGDLEKKSGILGVLGSTLENFAKAVEQTWTIIKGIGSGIFDFFVEAFNAAKEFVGINDLADFLDMLKKGVAIFVSAEFGLALKGIADLLKGLNNMYGGPSKAVKLINATSKALGSLAAVFISLSIGLAKIAEVDPDDLAAAAGTMEILASVLTALATVLVIVYNKTKNVGTAVGNTQASVADTLKASAGVGIAKGFKILAARIGVAAEITAVAVGIKEIASALKELSISIIALYVVFNDPNSGLQYGKIAALAGILTGFGAIFGVLVGALTVIAGKVSPKSRKNLNVAADIAAMSILIQSIALSLTELSAAILVLTVASAIDQNAMDNAFGTMVGLIFALGFMLAIIVGIVGATMKGDKFKGGGGKIFAAATVIQAIAGAIMIFAGTIIALSLFDAVDLIPGFVVVIAMVAMMVIVVKKIAKLTEGLKGGQAGKNQTAAIWAMVVLMIGMFAAMTALTKELSGFSEDQWGPLLIVMVGLLAIIAAIATAGKVLGGKTQKEATRNLEALAGIALVISSLYVAALAIEKLASIKLGDEAIWTFVALTAILALLIGAGALIGGHDKLEEGLLSLGTAFLGFGAGIFLVCAGLSILLKAFEDIKGKENDIEETFKAVGYGIAAGLLGFVTAFLEGLAAELGNMIALIGDIIIQLIVGICDWVASNAVALGAAIGRLVAAIAVIIVAAFVQLCVDIIAAIKEAFGEHSPSTILADIGKNLILGLINGIKNVLEFLWNLLTDIVEGVINVFKSIWNTVVTLITDIIDWVTSGFKADKFIQIFADLFDGIIDYFSTIFDTMFNIGRDVITFFKNGIENVIDTILGVFSALITGILDDIAAVLGEFWDKGGEIVSNLSNGIKEAVEDAKNAMKSIIDAIAQWLVDKWNDFVDWGEDIIDAIVGGIEDSVGGVIAAVGDMCQAIWDTLFGWLEPLRDAAFEIFDEIVNGANDTIDKTNAIRSEHQDDVDSYFYNQNGTGRTADQLYKEYRDALTSLKSTYDELERLDAAGTDKMSKEWNEAYQSYQTKLGNLKTQSNYVLKALQNTRNYISDMGYETNDFMVNLGGEEYYNVKSAWEGIGKDVVDGFSGGILKYANRSNKVTYAWMEGTANQAMAALDIQSPSKVFRRIGFFTVEGFNIALEEGFKSSAQIVMNGMNDLSDTASKYDMTPVIDTTEVQNKARLTADIFRHAGLNMHADVELMNKTNTSKIDNLSGAVTNLTAATDNATVNSRLDAQNALINKILDKFDTMGVYLDSGAMVGGISSKMDKALGFRAGQVSRGVR